MHKKGHYGAALTAYAPVGMGALTLGFDVAAVGGGLVALGLAMLPDVDMNLPNVAHRGPTHTIHFAFGVGIVTGVLGGVIGQAATSHWLLAVGSGFYLALGCHTVWRRPALFIRSLECRQYNRELWTAYARDTCRIWSGHRWG
jgi:inner membrane protein